ncbi:MAG: aldo/keto reductase, partial [Clostridia bacterium]|nr:aldo/keto reductase [Clostridia bacterium]
IGRALEGRRDKVMIQGHIGACWVDGQYKVSRDIDEVTVAFEDLLTRLKTDYIDVGFIHFVDKLTDWEALPDSDMMRYVLSLKEKGIIKAVGMSSHDPITAKKAVESGLIDVLMFSLNPAYDLLPPESDMVGIFDEVVKGKEQNFTGFTLDPTRAELYRVCEERGVAITVMKALAMGTLLSEKRSPLGVALTEAQCISYALNRPSVSAVMVGMQSGDEVKRAVEYYDTAEEEKNYSQVLGTLGMFNSLGRCMYCNHCLPCPSRIDIASVNKYLDLVELDKSPADSVKAHYSALDVTAESCISCGVCEDRCPFMVKVTERMKRAVLMFGNNKNQKKGLPADAIADRVDFYSEMIDDLTEDGLSEEAAVAEVGNIDSIVKEIIDDTSLTKLIKEKVKQKKRLKWWELTLIIVGSPIWLSILIAALAVILSLYISVWSVVASLWSVFASFAGIAFGGLVYSVASFCMGETLSGIACIGIAIASAGLAIFVFYGCKAVTKGWIWLTKKMFLGIKKAFVKREAV